MEQEEIKKKNMKRTFIMLGTVFLVLMLCLIGVLEWYRNNQTKTSPTYEIQYDDYLYKIRYDFGCETYIYVFKDETIKVVSVEEIYESQEDCDCMVFTGDYHYTEQTIHFSEDSLYAVMSVFEELATYSGKNTFNADNMDLTKYQERILLAVVTDCEDQVTIEANLDYEEVKQEYSLGNYKITNTKRVLNESTENEVVNKIAVYLNEIVSADFEQYNQDGQTLVKERTSLTENMGVTLTINLVYAGPYNLSFLYTVEGQLGTQTIYDVKGYTFHYAGEIREFDMNGWKEDCYQKALKTFMEDDLYIQHSDELSTGWQQIFYDNMYVTGNWYMTEDRLTFLIPADLLGLDESTAKVVIVEVSIEEAF